jgi:cyclohexyl-isocyanide hydratase
MHVGMLLYPGLTQLDLTGPFEVFHRIPGAAVHLVWKEETLVRADSGLSIASTKSFADCPALDVLFVPGGGGVTALLTDAETLRFLRNQGEKARYVTSVCTGALLLGAAGLLEGYDAATHWMYMEVLPAFGARPVSRRVVIDRNRITAGGVTAGIDFGLRVLAEIAGEERAKEVQLALEYDPEPPFRCGHPRVADPRVVLAVKEAFASRLAERTAVVASITRAWSP